MSEPVAQAPKFRVFSVLGQSFSVLFRNIVPFGIISLVFSSPGYIFYQFTDPFDFLIKPQVPFIIASIPSVFVMAVFASGVCRILARPDLNNFRSSIHGVWIGFPALGIVVIMAIVWAYLGVGILAFFPEFDHPLLGHIPVEIHVVIFILIAILACLFWVILPVAVLERRFLSSFGRSAFLSKGYRWRILVIAILLVLFSPVFRSVIGLGSAELADMFESYAPVAAIDWIVSAFLSAFSAVVVAVSYHRLRLVKDGMPAHEIEAALD
ncbi:MAG: hypothetical protein HOM52_04205 [Rhodospirillaceae bacterium]|jgi:hypothetical protein|nr:hypothetical protein [Rhodospirillaceae bacterium]MBT3928827.1 hypothetical protein [Rhodospirillaceae bacterium]MBT4427527.1 hypothetical protein [Rhodospirillaceae bacterium]MBT5037693.1 hypothetical protein [Rhodospirillaceae bacterium]MBT5676698.1 hypothetical protein [Rhodospirillaceae bacterium]